ncbi:hypothetical protein OROMI_013582 [Orobanche minor]
MGFDREGSFCIKISSTPDQLKDFLDALVKWARIIKFNEVELYFGGDVINLGDCISMRNELEALHSSTMYFKGKTEYSNQDLGTFLDEWANYVANLITEDQ